MWSVSCKNREYGKHDKSIKNSPCRYRNRARQKEKGVFFDSDIISHGKEFVKMNINLIEGFIRANLKSRTEAAAELSIPLQINGIEFIPQKPVVELRSGIFDLAEMVKEKVAFEVKREGSVAITTYSFKLDGVDVIQREYKLAESEGTDNG